MWTNLKNVLKEKGQTKKSTYIIQLYFSEPLEWANLQSWGRLVIVGWGESKRGSHSLMSTGFSGVTKTVQSCLAQPTLVQPHSWQQQGKAHAPHHRLCSHHTPEDTALSGVGYIKGREHMRQCSCHQLWMQWKSKHNTLWSHLHTTKAVKYQEDP